MNFKVLTHQPMSWPDLPVTPIKKRDLNDLPAFPCNCNPNYQLLFTYSETYADLSAFYTLSYVILTDLGVGELV